MLPDLEVPDLSYPDIILSSDFSGLEIYQCENWTYDSLHGGNIGTSQIYDGENSIFPRTSRIQNVEGYKQYRKTFWVNAGTETWENIAPVVTQNATAQFPRETVTVAIGTATDSMTNKPNDSVFSGQPAGVTIEPGQSIAVWIRQIITPGGVAAEIYSNVTCTIQLMEV